jgi:hypothetical protein
METKLRGLNAAIPIFDRAAKDGTFVRDNHLERLILGMIGSGVSSKQAAESIRKLIHAMRNFPGEL